LQESAAAHWSCTPGGIDCLYWITRWTANRIGKWAGGRDNYVLVGGGGVCVRVYNTGCQILELKLLNRVTDAENFPDVSNTVICVFFLILPMSLIGHSGWLHDWSLVRHSPLISAMEIGCFHVTLKQRVISR
jgi:hypothetical protein